MLADVETGNFFGSGYAYSAGLFQYQPYNGRGSKGERSDSHNSKKLNTQETCAAAEKQAISC